MPKHKLLKTDFKFFSLDPLFEQCPKDKFYYYLIIGERSNGKSFSIQEYALREYLEHGTQLAHVRRWDTDWEGNTTKIWEMFVTNPYRGNIVKELSKGKWNDVLYYRGAWYLAKRAEKPLEDPVSGKPIEVGEIIDKDPKPFSYRFCVNLEEHYKGTSYPNIGIIFFDEFITRGYYLKNEFIMFMSLVSTLVRLENKTRIFMVANTISTACPYFTEMGIRRIKQMQPGQTDIYEYGDSDLKVAVHYCENDDKRKTKKKSNSYFAFENPSLKMVTSGGWEIDIYPHLPSGFEYTKKDILYFYFIQYQDEIFHCELIYKKDIESLITYIHKKTTPIKEDNRQLVFTPEYDMRPWYSRRITKPTNNLHRLILNQFVQEKVYYQDNEIGESVRHYLDWCMT